MIHLRPRFRAVLAVGIMAVAVLAGCASSAPEGAEAAESAEGADSGGFFSFLTGPSTEPVEIPAGTALRVRTTTTLSTAANSTGESFVGSLEEPLVVNGKTIAEKGAAVSGRVVLADKGGRVKNVASIGVTADSLETVDGEVSIQTGNYVVAAKKTHGKDAQKIGIGAGVGAAIGAIAGGGDGALKGAGAGAGAGTGAVLATRGDPAVIGAESVISLSLEAPVTVQVPVE